MKLRKKEIGLLMLVVFICAVVGLFLGSLTKHAKLDPRALLAAVSNPSPASPGYMMVNLPIPGTHTSMGVVGTKTGVIKFKMPWPAELLSVSGTYRVGNAISIDVTEGGLSVLSTPLVLNSTTVSEGVITDSAIADEATISINHVVSGANISYNPTVQLIFKRK